MEPTTWTPERALEMLRDYHSLVWGDFRVKWNWGGKGIAECAIEALESAAAEIERQKARADAAERAASDLATETQRMVSVAEKEVERIKAELAKAQQQHPAPTEGPSDEAIRDALDYHIHGPELRGVLKMIARRAGVRL